MARLQCIVSPDIEQALKSVLQVSTSPYVKYYEKFGFKDYRHNFVYNDDAQNFWIGYTFNLSDKLSEDSRTLVLEYNPNKNELEGKLLDVLRCVKLYSKQGLMIRGVDLAIDLKGVARNNIFFDKGYRKSYREFYENGSRTTYLGKRGWGGIKIYDKAKEQGDYDSDWTRVEYTIKIDVPMYTHNTFRKEPARLILQDMSYIWFMDVQRIKDINTRAIYICLQNGDIQQSELTPYIRRKLRGLADDMECLVLDNSIKQDMGNTILTYIDGLEQSLGYDALPF